MEKLLIVGAGQFGQVTKEIAQSLGKFEKIDFLDDNSEFAIGKIGDYQKFKGEYQQAIVAIGNPETRKRLLDMLKVDFNVDSIISPKAYVSDTAIIGKSSIIEPTAFINANTSIGEGCIICAGSIVNHNSTIGDYCHINCGAIVKSNSIVKSETKVDYAEVI